MLLGRKAVTSLDSILKSRNITLSTKVYRVKALLFPVVMYGCCLVTQLCLTICDPMGFSTPGFPVLHHLPNLAKTHIHWVGDAVQQVGDAIQLSLLIPFTCLQSFWESGSFEMDFCIRWPKYWSFSFSICPSNEYLELISFRIGWFDLLAVQGTLKILLQHHSLKASIPQCSASL